MRAEDAPRFRSLLCGMGRTYGTELDAVVLDVYWLALNDWELADFRAACAHLLKTHKFMPRPADFNALRKAGRPTAGEAWALVLQHLKGGYRSGGLFPEIDRAVAAIGGYRALAMMPVDQLHWQAKRFAEHFEDLRDAEETRSAVPHITLGSHDGVLADPRGIPTTRQNAVLPGPQPVRDAVVPAGGAGKRNVG